LIRNAKPDGCVGPDDGCIDGRLLSISVALVEGASDIVLVGSLLLDGDSDGRTLTVGMTLGYLLLVGVVEGN
jgi:hypothetical protein